MSRSCKLMIIGFSCLVFVLFLAWSASDPGDSHVSSVKFEEKTDIVIFENKEEDIINPQVAYRQSTNNNVKEEVMKSELKDDQKEEKNTTQLLANQGNVEIIQTLENPRPKTFFSSLNLTFADIELLQNNSIPTGIFIEACLEMGPFLTKLGSGISVIKKEVESNLHDINRIYLQDKELYHTLQAMVLSEIEKGVVMNHHTCSRSLRWIRRMYEFISIFLEQLATGQKDLTKAARFAYDKTISMHHNYFIRKAITTGLHLLPKYNSFLVSMSVNQVDAGKPEFEQIFKEDVLQYISTLKPICKNIQQFYKDHDLEN